MLVFNLTRVSKNELQLILQLPINQRSNANAWQVGLIQDTISE
jgi:hypothetical protein